MKFTRPAFQYMFKNPWYVLLLSVVPGVFFAWMVDIPTAKEVYLAFFTGNLSDCHFFRIFNTLSVFPFNGIVSVLFGVLSFLVIVAATCLIMAVMDKHMRIGKKTLNGILERINDNVISTFLVGLFYFVVYELFALIVSAIGKLIILWVPTKAVAYILFAIAFLGCLFVFLYVVSMFYLWLPCLQITGFRAFEALRYTNQLIEGKKRQLVFPMGLTLLLGNAVVIPAIMFLPSLWARVVLSAVYTFFYALFTVRMEVAYFTASGTEREDLKYF